MKPTTRLMKNPADSPQHADGGKSRPRIRDLLHRDRVGQREWSGSSRADQQDHEHRDEARHLRSEQEKHCAERVEGREHALGGKQPIGDRIDTRNGATSEADGRGAETAPASVPENFNVLVR
jgi:hypothetical protein